MIMSTVLNLFFIPVLYLLIEGLREREANRNRLTKCSPNKMLA